MSVESMTFLFPPSPTRRLLLDDGCRRASLFSSPSGLEAFHKERPLPLRNVRVAGSAIGREKEVPWGGNSSKSKRFLPLFG